jgi:hypothetical protein
MGIGALILTAAVRSEGRMGSAVNFRVGVNNIADKAPPVVANGNYSDCPNTSCNDNTWVGTYDTMGRYLYAHIQAKARRNVSLTHARTNLLNVGRSPRNFRGPAWPSFLAPHLRLPL